MPIRPENRSRYPKDWPKISQRIRQRARNHCEWCGIKNYSLGGRLENGKWLPAQPTGDNGLRLTWPKPGETSWCGNGETEGCARLKVVKIVLTVAHLDHTPENCSDDNLRALCQRCHNLYDAKMRRDGIRERSRAKAAVGDLRAQAWVNSTTGKK
jgi:hypothetical protein